jgi:hypothetical protein
MKNIYSPTDREYFVFKKISDDTGVSFMENCAYDSQFRKLFFTLKTKYHSSAHPKLTSKFFSKDVELPRTRFSQ